MIDFTITTDIKQPEDEVFAYVTDPGRLERWQSNTVSAVPDGPMRVGTRIREVHRGPGGRELESLVEVVEYEPNSRFALKMLEGALLLHSEFTFTPRDGRTRVKMRCYGEPTGALKLLGPVLSHQLRRTFAAACQNLKRDLEF